MNVIKEEDKYENNTNNRKSRLQLNITKYRATATWKWDIASKSTLNNDNKPLDLNAPLVKEEENEEEEDLCGICRQAFDYHCPNCKFAGDECKIWLVLLLYTNFFFFFSKKHRPSRIWCM